MIDALICVEICSQAQLVSAWLPAQAIKMASWACISQNRKSLTRAIVHVGEDGNPVHDISRRHKFDR